MREFRNDVVEAAAISSSLIIVGLATSRRSPGATCAVSTGGQANGRQSILRSDRHARPGLSYVFLLKIFHEYQR